MKKYLLILLLVCSLIPAMESGATDSNNSPHLSLDSSVLDLGTIPPDTVVTRSVRLHNSGTADLDIYSVFSDCGCTSSSYPSDPLPPDSIAEIIVNFNSKGRKPGPFRKNLRIRSNADNPRIILVVKGSVL